MGPGGSTTLWSPEAALRAALSSFLLPILETNTRNAASGHRGFTPHPTPEPETPRLPIQASVPNRPTPLADIHMENFIFAFPHQFASRRPKALEKSDFERNQVKRMISTGKLNMLPCLYLQPINVVVFHDPSGKTHLGKSLALRCFQRLSRPHLATQPCS